MNIIIASTNPVKIQATQSAFTQFFPNQTLHLTPHPAPSGVSDQPYTDQETLLGALNRASHAQSQYPNHDYWVGIEGGVQEHLYETFGFAWIVVKSPTHITKSRTATFTLPKSVVEQLKQGKELGQAMDILQNRTNTKQQEGAVGILTNGHISRADLYTHALILSIAPHINQALI